MKGPGIQLLLLLLCSLLLADLGRSMTSADAIERTLVLPVEAELSGPLEGARFQGAVGETVLDLELSGGELRRLQLPFAFHPGSLRQEADLQSALESFGAPDLLGATDSTTCELSPPGDWQASLERQRASFGQNPEGRQGPAVSSFGFWMLAAALLLGLGSRRRAPSWGLATGLLLSIPLFLLGVEPAGARTEVVLEGRPSGEGWSWTEFRRARDELALEAGEGSLLLLQPPAARLALLGRLDSGGRSAWVARAAGVLLTSARPTEAPGALSAGANDARDLALCWVRSPGGSWSAHGPWRRGEALPPARGGGDAPPPGWLAAGLPQGRAILVAQLEGRVGGAGAWLRLTGFELGER